jgi:hypothetical protein
MPSWNHPANRRLLFSILHAPHPTSLPLRTCPITGAGRHFSTSLLRCAVAGSTFSFGTEGDKLIDELVKKRRIGNGAGEKRGRRPKVRPADGEGDNVVKEASVKDEPAKEESERSPRLVEVEAMVVRESTPAAEIANDASEPRKGGPEEMETSALEQALLAGARRRAEMKRLKAEQGGELVGDPKAKRTKKKVEKKTRPQKSDAAAAGQYKEKRSSTKPKATAARAGEKRAKKPEKTFLHEEGFSASDLTTVPTEPSVEVEGEPSARSTFDQHTTFTSGTSRRKAALPTAKSLRPSPPSLSKSSESSGSSAPDAAKPFRPAPGPSNSGRIQSPSAPGWARQKAALAAKFGDEGWNPRRKLSPDAMLGIRNLHAEDPVAYSTPVLSEQFKISPEAIRRILRSKWLSESGTEKMQERRERWAKRHDKIWDTKAQLGLRPQREGPMRVRDASEGADEVEVNLWAEETLERARREDPLVGKRWEGKQAKSPA